MLLDSLLATTAAGVPESLATFRTQIDPEWIEQALRAHDRASLRTRRLPAEEALWLVIAMALFRDEPIARVVEQLELKLGTTPVARSSIAEARARLGPEPLEWLFTRTAEAWGHAAARSQQWHGLAIYGVDGSTLRVADSEANRAHFGGAVAGDLGRGPSGYPLLRVVALISLRTHTVAAACFGPYTEGEHTLATSLWDQIPAHSLTIVDRGFFAAHILLGLSAGATDRHWLVRAKAGNKWRVVKKLGRNDAIVEMDVSRSARAQHPHLPETWQMRAIKYRRPGFGDQVLLTSMLDPRRFLTDEIVAMYHERWELELAYGEIKTDMLDRLETIRSKSPATVAQEVWGLLIAYNLVRLEMMRIAKLAKVPPTRISFVATLRHICDFVFWTAGTDAPGAVPRRLTLRRERVAMFVLPERRPRSYPRAVKVKMSNYALKRPTDGKNG